MKADVWVPIYVGDYLADTTRLTTEQHGAYFLLILDYWRNGPPPDDDAVLAQITKSSASAWPALRRALLPFFSVSDGTWTHKRIEVERGKAAKSAETAAKKVAARWGDADDAGRRGRDMRSARMAEARALGRHTEEEWRLLVAFHGGNCVKCGSPDGVVKDHIKPVYQGGSDAIDNLQPMCRRCNASKGPDATDHRKTGWRDALNGASHEASEKPAGCLPSPSPITTTPQPPKGGRPSAVELKGYLANLKTAGEKFLPDDDPIWAYAEKTGLTADMLRLAFLAFKDRYLGLPKRYTDWRAVFRRSVKEGWMGLWYLDAASNSVQLTSKGRLALQQFSDDKVLGVAA